MIKDELADYLAIALSPGIGPTAFRLLTQQQERSAKEILNQPTNELRALGLNEAQTKGLKEPPWDEVERSMHWLEAASNHQLMLACDPDYPDLLQQITDPPSVLFMMGDSELLHSPQLAMVGSRNCTPGGADTAEEFAHYLAQSGLTITSGMAQGIDKHAHRGALKATGRTIAVTGTGIDRIYPSSNRELAHEIASKGLLVSEFSLGTGPNPGHFPRRNRIISGLSLGTLVVEATRNSGSLITARLSLEQGREVFAIPGSIHNPQARGCHQLIRQGAKLVDQAADIIEDIESLLGFIAEQIDNLDAPPQPTLDSEYLRLLEVMGYDPVSIDTLVQRSGLTVEQLSSMLLILELNDQIQTAPGGFYIRR